MTRHVTLCLTVVLACLTGCAPSLPAEEPSAPSVHYVEIVCADVDSHVRMLEESLGLSFGPSVADLGNARTATRPDGSLVGVRAPLAEHETPIVRSYAAVNDIKAAVKRAEAAGAIVAYPPTTQGDTGTWAICILGDVQHGFWQRDE